MKFVLFPGNVYSEDGDIHHITAPELARLYGVSYRECKVVYQDHQRSRGYRKREGDIELYPASNGDYTLPINNNIER